MVRDWVKARWEAFSAMAREWEEVFFWIPLALLGVVLLGAGVSLLWPHSGVEGPAGFVAVLAAVPEGILVTVMAWLSKRTYTHDLPDKREMELFYQSLRSTDSTLHAAAHRAIIRDRLEWAGWLALWFFLLRA